MILLGQKIKDLRMKNKYTQLEFAEKLGVTKSSVSAYENDSRTPSYEVLIKMADIFGVSIDSILLREADQNLDVRGLNEEQINIIRNLIVQLRSTK